MKPTKRVALLIDGDNVSATHAAAIVAIAKSHGDVIFSRAYINAGQGNGDWSKKNIDVLITGMGASVSDFRLSFEAVEMDVRGTHDVFVIATNDADLVHVVRWLTHRGRTVVVAGTNTMGKDLRNSGADVHMLKKAVPGAKPSAPAEIPQIIPAAPEPVAAPVAVPAPSLVPAETPAAPKRKGGPKLALSAGHPDPEAVATLIRSVLAQNGGEMMMTAFGNVMRSVYGVQPKHGGQRTWRRYLDTQKEKFLLTGSDALLRITLRSKAAQPDAGDGVPTHKENEDV